MTWTPERLELERAEFEKAYAKLISRCTRSGHKPPSLAAAWIGWRLAKGID